jgi:hypothetical protein
MAFCLLQRNGKYLGYSGSVQEMTTVVVSQDKINDPRTVFQCHKVIGHGQSGEKALWVGWNWSFYHPLVPFMN